MSLCILLSSIMLVLGEEPAIWDKTYGGINDDDCVSVLKAKDGGYILASETVSFGAGETDVWLIKTDVNCKMEWNKTYGGAASNDVQFVIADDGGYLLAGFSASYGPGDIDVVLIKTNAQGIIPEFPSWIIIPLFLMTTLVVVLYRNRLREIKVKF